MSDVLKSIAAVEARIDKLLKDSMENPHGAEVATMEQILHLLHENQLMYVQHAHGEQVAVHCDNRYGSGISVKRVYELMSNIFKKGFSFAQCREALAFELPPESKARCQKLLSFNKTTIEGCAGRIPEYALDNVRFVSVTCSHCNQTLRCINHGLQHDDEAMCEDGKLAAHKVANRDGSYGIAMQKGLEWRVAC